MAGQKRPTRPVEQAKEPFDGFDAPRWYGPDGTLVSGRLEPGTPPATADVEPPASPSEVPPPAEPVPPLDSQPTEPVA